METFLQDIYTTIGTYLPNVLGALAILIIGWLVALMVSAIVKRVLRKTSVDEKLAGWVTGKEEGQISNAGDWIAKGVFYLMMLFVLAAFFQALQLTIVTEPINSLLNKIFAFGPQLLGGAVLILVAWGVATLLKMVIIRGLSAVRLDERLSGEQSSGNQISLSKSLAEAAYWFVFLLFLPAILTALQLEGLLLPIQAMLNKILGFLPNVITAGVIVLAGWFVARIVQRIISNLLAAVGTDRLSEKVGLSTVLGKQKLSGLLGLILYIFILIPVIISALNALALDAITAPASNMLNMILEAIPSIFAALLILTLSYVIGKMIAGLVSNLLAGIGFDNLLTKLGISKTGQATYTPSSIVGSVILIAIMFFAFTEAFNMLGFTSLSALSSQLIVFGSHILLGLIIFAAGLYLANLVATTIRNSSSSQSHLLAIAARAAILILTGAMALRQMGLANEIITLAFGLLLGAVAISAAIAFGVGGRELAARKLQEWNQSISDQDTGEK